MGTMLIDEHRAAGEGDLVGLLTGRQGPAIFNHGMQDFLLRGLK